MSDDARGVHRRRFLAAAAAAGALLSGCTGLGSGPGDDESAGGTSTSGAGATTAERTTASTTTGAETTQSGTTGTGSTTGETTAAGTTRTTASGGNPPPEMERKYETDLDHPAATKLGLEPTDGKYPSETKATIVEFQDASCDICAEFAAGTYPILYSNLVAPGKATFVSRDYPHTEPWAMEATYALDSVYAREPETYWKIRSWYYSRTNTITEENILDKTRHFLDTETDLDTEAVIRDITEERVKSAVQRDVRVAKKAGAKTPSFFLFRDGQFVTKLVGNQDYAVFKNSLGF